ncbi:hypothetical protein ACWDSJ_28940 [Nocardia sp. NPDC003482]
MDDEDIDSGTLSDFGALLRDLTVLMGRPMRNAFRQAGGADEKKIFPTIARLVKSRVGEKRWTSSPSSAVADVILEAITRAPELMTGRQPKTERHTTGNSEWKGMDERKFAEIIYGFRDDTVSREIGTPIGQLTYKSDYYRYVQQLSELKDSSVKRMLTVIREDIAYALLDMEADALDRRAAAAEPAEDLSDALRLSPRPADLDQARTEEIIQVEFLEATDADVYRLALTLHFDPCLTKAVCSYIKAKGMTIAVACRILAIDTALFLDSLAEYLQQPSVTRRYQGVLESIESKYKKSMDVLDLLVLTQHDRVSAEYVTCYLMGWKVVEPDMIHHHVLTYESAIDPLFDADLVHCDGTYTYMNPLVQTVCRNLRRHAARGVLERIQAVKEEVEDIDDRIYSQTFSLIVAGWSPVVAASRTVAELIASHHLKDILLYESGFSKAGRRAGAEWLEFLKEAWRAELYRASGVWHVIELLRRYNEFESFRDVMHNGPNAKSKVTSEELMSLPDLTFFDCDYNEAYYLRKEISRRLRQVAEEDYEVYQSTGVRPERNPLFEALFYYEPRELDTRFGKIAILDYVDPATLPKDEYLKSSYRRERIGFQKVEGHKHE